MEANITIFPTVEKPKDPHYITIENALERIRTGGKFKDLIAEIRTLTDKKERDVLKLKLPAICFSGKFKIRKIDGILEHSGYICLDFDHLNNIEDFKEALKKDKYTFAVFLSPSGDGLKLIVKIPNIIEKHKTFFESLRMYYSMENMAGWDDLKDITRVCYQSYDPDIYINQSSALFDIEIKPKPTVVEFIKDDGKKVSDNEEIYRRVKSWAERTNNYTDGNKHNYLVYFCSACNRFGLNIDFLVTRIIQDYQDKASHVSDKDFKDIAKRVYITYSNQHNISFFTKDGQMSDFDPEAPARDVIYLDSIRDDMINSFLKGDARGETTYFNSIDNHWRWKKGEINLMHGLPNHGKSTLMLQLMLIKSVKEGSKWGVFSPEQNPPIDFYKELIHMYIGKSTEHYMPNQMSILEYNQGMDFMKEHFYFIYPKDDSPTPQYINDRFDELIIKHEIVGCLTDPFNQLDNDWMTTGGRDDLYISSFLSKEKRFALDRDVYKIVIAHPKGNVQKVTEKNQDEELENLGNYDCPDVYDLAGGAMWNNKMDNILVTYQPYYTTRYKAPRDSSGQRIVNTKRAPELVQFRSQKIKKQKLNGQPGTSNLIFNIASGRYYEEDLNDCKKSIIYCPFDKEYESFEYLSQPKVVSETDWEAFKNLEPEKKEDNSNLDALKEIGFLEQEFNLDDDNIPDFSNFEDF